MSNEDIEARLRQLEQKVGIIQNDLTYLKEGQDRWNNAVSRLLWLIGGGFIAAIVTWIVGGGVAPK